MDPSRFDSISRLFAERRLSRRQAVRTGSAGLAAGALAAAGLSSAARAQEATPEIGELLPGESSVEKSSEFLFVQSFRQGAIAAKTGGGPGDHTVTLEHGLGQTIYFSNRPERIVGAAPTPNFLAGLGFPDENPPNAALLVETEDGVTEIAVVELFNPRYDEDTHTATYDLQVLEQWEEGVTFAEQPQDLAEITPAFNTAHLFIDDCADRAIYCMVWANQGRSDAPPMNGWGPQGFCYSWGDWGCYPCDANGQAQSAESADAFWKQKCTDTFEECADGGCVPLYAGPLITG